MQLKNSMQNAEKREIPLISETKDAIFLTYTDGNQEVLSEN